MNTKISKKIVYITMLFIVLICSCKKKYPEDPRRTFKDVNVRITGEWQATSLTIYGQDKLYIIDSLNVDRYRFLFYKNDKNSHSDYAPGSFVAIDKQGSEIYPDTAFSMCEFNYGNQNNLNFRPVQGPVYLPHPLVFFPGYNQYTHKDIESWKILKLTYKEMKLQSLVYDIVIEMKKVKEISPL
jgi:hypothetical protein